MSGIPTSTNANDLHKVGKPSVGDVSNGTQSPVQRQRRHSFCTSSLAGLRDIKGTGQGLHVQQPALANSLNKLLKGFTDGTISSDNVKKGLINILEERAKNSNNIKNPSYGSNDFASSELDYMKNKNALEELKNEIKIEHEIKTIIFKMIQMDLELWNKGVDSAVHLCR